MRPEFEKAMVTVMVAVARADREMDKAEEAAIHRIFRDLAHSDLSPDLFKAQVALAKKWGFNLQRIILELAPRLNEMGREVVLRAAATIAVADRRVDDRELKMLMQIASFLEMTPTHSRAVLEEVGVWKMKARQAAEEETQSSAYQKK